MGRTDRAVTAPTSALAQSGPLAPALAHAVGSTLTDALHADVGSAIALGVVRSDGRRGALWLGRTVQWVGRPAQRVDGASIHEHTPFDLASLTKPMVTSTLLAREVAAGALRLDTPLAQVLPDAAPSALGSQSLRLLLGHGSGAEAWHDFFADTEGLDGARRQAAIRRAVLSRPLARPPGSAAVYSDLGFLALGWALEALAGTSLRARFQAEIAAPLGLSRSDFRPLDGAASDASPTGSTGGGAAAVVATEIWPPRCEDGAPLQGVVHDDNCAGLGGVAGHAGLFAPVGDVLTWARVWLRAARGDTDADGGEPFLSARLVQRWVRSAAAPNTTWRLGWDTPSRVGSSAGDRASRRAFGHLGFTGTSVWIDPERDAAVVLLTNRVHPSRVPRDGIRALRPRVHDAVWRWLDQADATPR